MSMTAKIIGVLKGVFGISSLAGGFSSDGPISAPAAAANQPGNPLRLAGSAAAVGSGGPGGNVVLTPGPGDGAGLPGFGSLTGKTHSGNPLMKFLPDSGTSKVQINDNGTVIIDADAGTGTLPLTIKCNGALLWQFSASGGIADVSPAGTGSIGLGGGYVQHICSGGVPFINTFNELRIQPGQLGGGGIRSIGIISQNAADIPFYVKGAASQSGNLQEWRNSAGAALLTVNAAGSIVAGLAQPGAKGNDAILQGTPAATGSGLAGGDVVLTPGSGDGAGASGIISLNGIARGKSGTSAKPSYSFTDETSSGFTHKSGVNQVVYLTLVGTDCVAWRLNVGSIIPVGNQYLWCSASDAQVSGDAGLARQGPAIIAATNGSTGPGIYSVPLALSGQAGNDATLQATAAAAGSGLAGGNVIGKPASGDGAGANGFFVVQNPDGVSTHQVKISHDGTNGIVQAASGALVLSPTGGAVRPGASNSLAYFSAGVFYSDDHIRLGVNVFTFWFSGAAGPSGQDAGFGRIAAGVLGASLGVGGSPCLIGGGAAPALTAAGTNQGNSLQLGTANFHELTTVAAGTGVKLVTAIAGCDMSTTIKNAGANAVLVYPATGAQINSLGTNVGYQLSPGASVTFRAASATQWYSTGFTTPGAAAIVLDADAPTVTLSMTPSNRHELTLGGNRTLAASNVTPGQVFSLRLTQDAIGGRAVTWWNGISWPGGVVPTLTPGPYRSDAFVFECRGVNVYDGFLLASNLM